MRTILVIGIGAGNPDFLTLQAIEGLSRADVVLALDKGESKSDLLALREKMVLTHAPGTPIVAVADPQRDRNPGDEKAYEAEVKKWHIERARLLAEAVYRHTTEDGAVAFLVWGDPSLYDSTLRIIEHMKKQENLEAKIEVIPGVTALQVLTAAHGILLNRIGESIHVTTGRKLPQTSAADRRNCVVMLDGGSTWLEVATEHTYMWWGAYLGTKDEVLRAGYVHEIGEEVAELKAKLREEHGWIMDTYLLRELD